MSADIRLVACPHPFSSERIDLMLPPGGTLAEMLEIAQPDPVLRRHAHVFIGDHRIAPCYWRGTRPKAGQVITVRVVPTGGGGGGGGGGKNPMRTVLTIAVVIAAIYTGGLAAGALGLTSGTLAYAAVSGVVSMAVSTVGMLLVNAIAPPPKASSTDLSRDGGSLDRASPALSITGSANQADPYGPVPRVYGRVRFYPKKAAREYTEVVGNDQYLRCLFDFGYGPLDLSDLRIGAIPIEQFEAVELEVRQGWPDDEPLGLYTSTPREDAYSLKVSASAPQIVESRDGADEITVDVAFNGLVKFGGSGERQEHSVTLRVEWRRVGAADWLLHAEETITGATESAVRKGWRIITASPGRYQIRLTRLTADNANTSIRDDSYLTAVRTIQYSYPVKRAGRCLVAMRIKATDQLNGQIDQFSAVAQARLRVWTGTAWAWMATRNQAWAFCDVLLGAANKRAVADSRLDLATIKAWADSCDALAQDGQPKWTFDAVIDYVSTVFEMLRDIAASARAALSMRDGKFSVVRDVPQTVPVQVFTPRNSWGFKASKLFIDLPHALRVRYIEPDREWSQQEVAVYADGYSEATATKFEALEMFGCTRRTQAWREGRYHQAVACLRPETFEFQADIEHLVCTRGDLIRVAHDVPMWGGGWGRIKALTHDEQGRIVGCRLDERIAMEDGKGYVLRVRGEGGVGGALSVETQAGETDQLTFQAPVPAGQEPEIGDLAVFGEAGRESALLLVKSIHPGPNFTARLTCVDASPAVHDADSGPIPAYDPGMSLPPINQPQAPRQPVITQVCSDESVLVRTADGRSQPRILVTVSPDTGLGVSADAIQAQYRRAGSGETWMALAPVPASSRQVAITPVEEGIAYDLRLRMLSREGLASDWTVPPTHTVIGRTTPPPDAAGFRATRRADGVQLSWEPASPLDVVGYEVREGSSWGSGTVVTTRYRGTTLFVALSDAADHTFHIRAIDELALMSQSAATVITSVIAPGSVESFSVVPQGDFVRLTWAPLAESVEYEVRAGESWASGRAVGRSAGDHLVALWPVRQPVDETFWLKAVSSAGLYSQQAAYTTILLAPLSDRNVVLTRDFKAEGWPGTFHGLDITTEGWLALASAGGRGEYFERIDLGRSYRARNWVDLRSVAVATDTTNWDDAAFTWDWADADRPWLVTSETDGRRVLARIALPAPVDPALIEGFGLTGTVSGLRGAQPMTADGVSYGRARFGDGLLVNDLTHVAWAVAVPETFSLTFTLRPQDEGTTVEMVSLASQHGDLAFGWDAASQCFYLTDPAEQMVAATVPWLPGDVIDVAISQTATARTLQIASLRTGLSAVDRCDFAAQGAFNELHVFGASAPRSWGAMDLDWQDADVAWEDLGAPWHSAQPPTFVLADLAVWLAALDALPPGADQSSPLGFGPFLAVQPGDYEYREAYLSLTFDGSSVGGIVSLSAAALSVDVPDVRDRGAAAVAASGTFVSFGRAFHAAPEVQATLKSSATFAAPEIFEITEAGFHVRLRTQDGTCVAGAVSWSALGY